MSSRADAAAILRRVEVRLGLGLAAAIGLLLLGLASVFFLLATHETTELLEESLERELASAAAQEPGVVPVDPEAPIAVRRVETTGEVHLLQGRWPAAGAFLAAGTSSVRLAFADPSAHFLMERSLADGGSLQATTSLAAFVGERREQLGQILISLALSLVGLLAVTLVATRLALAPVRAATLAVERVDEHHLDRRIPVRGTGDDLDCHARALNRVLARLEEAFRRMEAFSADVAHELRTPVNRILNLADLAILREGARSRAPELTALREAAGGMQRLIDDLLLLAKGDWGRLAARSEPVALKPLLDGLASLFRPTFEERKITLVVRERGGNVVALGDPNLLQRAVANLLDNAVRFTPPGGDVELSAGRGGSLAFIEVSDSGSGIAEADRRRIFDRFVQIDEARSGEGTGLGLALVRMIARVQGGDVSVGTAQLGGACFRITLPATRP
jgi:two-component system heavy metal sensor histidine kinase CusS